MQPNQCPKCKIGILHGVLGMLWCPVCQYKPSADLPPVSFKTSENHSDLAPERQTPVPGCLRASTFEFFNPGLKMTYCPNVFCGMWNKEKNKCSVRIIPDEPGIPVDDGCRPGNHPGDR